MHPTALLARRPVGLAQGFPETERPVAGGQLGAIEAEGRGFDIDAVTEDDLVMPSRLPSSVVMEDLDRVIGTPDLMPPGTVIQPLGHREYGLSAPGMSESVRVTTDPVFFEEHSESVELWSPGNVLFQAPDVLQPTDVELPAKSLKEILEN